MILFPNAKINLGLNILRKREDGFHDLETIFYPINWNDILEIHESDHLEFISTGLEIKGDPEDNLCLKAYRLIQKDFGIGNVRIHLHKNIPMGAGLGGGSADASFTLIGLNELFQLNLSETALLKYAEILGSDCAFFIKNKPCLGSERGNILEEIPVSLKEYHIVLVYPNVLISTQKAYSGVIPKIPKTSLKDRIVEQVETWEFSIENDFEISIFQDFPELKKIKEILYDNGAVYAAMSGSGSTMFGIFKSNPNLKEKFPNYVYFETILTH